MEQRARNKSKFKFLNEKKVPLASFEFRLNPLIQGSINMRQFIKANVPRVFKCTPDRLLNLCVKVLDEMPLPIVYKWSVEEICIWLGESGYRQYQHTFRENLITGRNLLLLDSSALAAMNITNFDHIKEITRQIRDLFYFDVIRYGRCLTLYPESHDNLYKIFRLKTGFKYNVRRSDLWRKMQVIRQNYETLLNTHWDVLELWLANKNPKCKELFGAARVCNLICKV